MVELPGARVVKDGGTRADARDNAPPPRLSLAPRAVPLALVSRLWFGGTFASIGWILACVGMAFTLFFLPRIELVAPDYDRSGFATITHVEETTSENDDPSYRVQFTFTDEDGATHTGASYTTDAPVDRVLGVEYLANDPDESRLAGMRSQPYSRGGLFVLILPIIGLGIAISQLVTGYRAMRLLRSGLETRGTLLAKRETNASVDDLPVMALTFEYLVDRRPYQVTVKTLSPSLLEDDAQEPMLYDPHQPSRATTLDHLPGAPTITADGQISSNPDFAVLVLILPIVTIALIVATAVVLAVR